MKFFYFQKSHQQNDTWISADASAFESVKLNQAIHIGTTFLSQANNFYEGDLWLDIDKKEHEGGIKAAITSTKAIAKKLESLGVKLNQVELFASGNKGFHIRIPLKIFDGIAVPNLPKIFKKIAAKIDELAGGDTGIDFSMYNGGKGKLIRVENKQRIDNKQYKVQITWEELETLTPESYKAICSTPREKILLESPETNKELSNLMSDTFSEVSSEEKNLKGQSVVTPKMFEGLEEFELPCKLVIMSGADNSKSKNASNNNKCQSIALLQDLGLATDSDVAEYARNNVTDNNSESDLLNHVRAARSKGNTKELTCGLMLHQTGVTKSSCKNCPIPDILNPVEPANIEALENSVVAGTLNLLGHVSNTHIIKRLALEASAATNIPANTVFLVGLSITSAFTVRHRVVSYRDGTILPTGLSNITESPSGSGKSRVMKTFTEPFKRIYIERRAGLLLELKRLDVKTQKDRKAEIEAKLAISFLITDSTPEALSATLAATCGIYGTASCEQSLTNSLLGKSYGDGKASNNELLLSGFDGGFVNIKRVSRDGYSGDVGGAVILCAQAGSVSTLVTESNETGLAERFLMLAEPNRIGTQDYFSTTEISQKVLQEYAEVCKRIAATIFINPEPLNALPVMTISKDGWHLINEFRNQIEPLRADGKRFSHGSLRGATGKVDMQIMKIAANLQIAESPQLEIELEYVKSAIAIVKDLTEEHFKLLEALGFIGKKAEQVAIINYLTKSKSAGMVEIYNAVRGVTPFKAMTGNKSEAIKLTIKNMIADGLVKESSSKYSLQ
jgi:hypothetical protein